MGSPEFLKSWPIRSRGFFSSADQLAMRMTPMTILRRKMALRDANSQNPVSIWLTKSSVVFGDPPRIPLRPGRGVSKQDLKYLDISMRTPETVGYFRTVACIASFFVSCPFQESVREVIFIIPFTM